MNELAGSPYREKVICYFVITEKDTSDFRCVFSKTKLGGTVNIDLNIPHFKNTVSHAQRFKELGLILQKASKDFDFDSLDYLRFGRLVQSGDLAIEVTKEYKRKNPSLKNLFSNYNTFEQFLTTSKLGRDVEEVFQPYSVVIASASIEKLFLTSKQDLYRASKIETDSTEVPVQVLDCQIVVQLKRY